jgi:hypothetical protein
MEIHTDRLKLLIKKRSIGAWIFWLLAAFWKRLGDWQNFAWFRNHVMPQAWTNAVLHPNYVTVTLALAGLAWITTVLLWPKKSATPQIVGDANLLMVRLAIEDINIQPDFSIPSVDLGVFVKMTIASADRPRTIRGFLFQQRLCKVERKLLQHLKEN